MGMANSDDEQAIEDRRQDLEDHFKNSPPSERRKYERMSDEDRAYYEAEVRQKAKR